MAINTTDPIDVKVDPVTGDVVVGPGGLSLTYSLDGVAQAIRIRLQLFLGEWFLNLDKGVDWWGQILGQKYNPTGIRSEIVTCILGTVGVLAVNSFRITFDPSARAVGISANIATVFGDVPLTNLVITP